MASDGDFYILRKFDVESARIALWLQDGITQLSEKLKEVDQYYEENGAHCGKFRTNGPDARNDLLCEMAFKLERYRERL